MEQPKPILFVAGLGRCGTTMVMNMLHRGGFPVAGPAPAFEVEEMGLGRVNLDWVRAQGGKAVKWIDPNNASIGDIPNPVLTISMTRDAMEQGRSQIKLMKLFGMPVVDDRKTRRAFQKAIESDTSRMVHRLMKMGAVLHLEFSEVLGRPDHAAKKIDGFLRYGFDRGFDPEAAASVVINRSPACAPDMSVEMGYHG